MKKRLMALITTVALMMTMIIASAAVTVNAASSYEVPVKAIWYYNSSGGDDPVWVKTDANKYKYNTRGNLANAFMYKLTWKYKGKNPVSVTTGSKKAGAVYKATYKKGKISKASVKYYNDKGKLAESGTATFKYRKNWIIKYTENLNGTRYVAAYSYKFYKNGMPKTLTVTTSSGSKPYKTVVTLNKKGLVTRTADKYGAFTHDYRYDKAGRVIEMITSADGRPVYRAVYKYNGKKSDRKTYIGIMSDNALYGAVRDVMPFSRGMLSK